MAGLIPEAFIQDLLARVDVVSVVERHVPLRKAGINYSACCPFHNEKTPSFTVSPTKQFYYCFGCGAHGSAIGFLMEYSGLGFVEAVEELATSVGLQVPRPQTQPDAAATAAYSARTTTLAACMTRAAQYYRQQLKASERAIDYLKGRGLSGEIAARFGLGYAPAGWQSLAEPCHDYAHNAALAECGLVIDNEQGRRYDRFRDRIMFPILDQRGNVIAFGGRILDQGEPKYLNSPETPLFEKGRELYGLTQARKAIREQDAVIVVEGYMDVVGLAQLGIENVVATLGTATTGLHLQKLFRLTDRVIFCFDRDAAGDKAARRAVEVALEFLADNKSVEVLQMPGNQDPDEFVRTHGKEAFLALASSATRLSEFLVRQLVQETQPYSAEGRAQLIHVAKPLLARVQAPVLRLQLIKALSGLAQMTTAEIEAACDLKPLQTRRRAPLHLPPRQAARSLEYRLLENVLRQPARARRLPLELIIGEAPEAQALRAIVQAVNDGRLLLADDETGGQPDASPLGQLLEYFRDTEVAPLLVQFAASMTDAPGDAQALEAEFADALTRLEQVGLTQAITSLSQKERQLGLSVEERQQYVKLLGRKAQAARPRQEG